MMCPPTKSSYVDYDATSLTSRSSVEEGEEDPPRPPHHHTTEKKISKRQQLSKFQESQSYSALYDPADHWSVLTRRYGSLWPRVLPYCLFNSAFMLILSHLNKHVLSKDYATQLHSLQISNQGHSLITVVVAFLLISRLQSVLQRFDAARTSLGQMYRNTREVIANSVLYSACGSTCETTDDQHVAEEWRLQVAYRMLLLLRTSMAVMDYPTDFIPAWQVPELQGEELQDILKQTFVNPDHRSLLHEERSEFEESMRIPIRMSYLVKQSILNTKHKPHPCSSVMVLETAQVQNLLGSVDGFMTGFYGIRKFMTTPIPFPLVQMSRTFLFCYVFTVPFALLSDSTTGDLAHMIEVFIFTFGFMGLELVAIELDNPFGEDENDFNNLELAKASMEDAYLAIMDVDGKAQAEKLFDRMKPLGTVGPVGTNTTAGLSTGVMDDAPLVVRRRRQSVISKKRLDEEDERTQLLS